MIKVINTTDQEVVIDGLGIFAANETREVTDAELKSFQLVRGLPFGSATVPEGIDVEGSSLDVGDMTLAKATAAGEMVNE